MPLRRTARNTGASRSLQLADITCYSFYPGKNLGCLRRCRCLVTNNAEWATAVRMMANHGRTRKYRS